MLIVIAGLQSRGLLKTILVKHGIEVPLKGRGTINTFFLFSAFLSCRRNSSKTKSILVNSPGELDYQNQSVIYGLGSKKGPYFQINVLKHFFCANALYLGRRRKSTREGILI